MSATTVKGAGQERRRARTRQALVDAAVRLTARGRAEQATIQEITEEAGIGFGSFYNHFGTRGELFDAASAQVMERWGRVLDRACADMEDPAEVFTASFRISGLLGRTHPEHARFLTALGLGALERPDGLAPRARRDIEAARAAGRFRSEEPEIALSAAAGALVALLGIQLADPDRVGATVVDDTARGLLRLLGVEDAQAADLVSRPLPELDEEG